MCYKIETGEGLETSPASNRNGSYEDHVMADRQLPSKEVLRQLLDYDPETGVLRWKERGPEWFEGTEGRTAEHAANQFKARLAGKPALNMQGIKGYRCGRLLGLHVKSHRVIWKFVTGEDPDQIDHINGDPSDNRLVNLRAATNEINSRNRKRRKDNSSGIVGLSRAEAKGRQSGWIVKANGQYIGHFKCIGQAIRARREAERRHGFHPNHGRAA